MKPNLRGVIDDTALKYLRLRNETRLRAAREALGPLYLLHPSNRVTRALRNPGVLPFPVQPSRRVLT